MKRRWPFVAVLVLLGVALVATFLHPRLMLSPGPLIAAHARLADDCFACHAPLSGASIARCTSCHALRDIGIRRASGERLPDRGLRSSFHQYLIEQDCMACHSDHRGVRLAAVSSVRFAHALLVADVRQRCSACHVKPDDTLHRGLRQNCGACHAATGWRPATFDHSRYFLLDRDHDGDCLACHAGGDFSRYTCYGCHEHSPERTRREHLEEGLRDIEDCVECHRSADEPPDGWQRGRDGSQRGGPGEPG